MNDAMERRLRELARRAGVAGLPPSAMLACCIVLAIGVVFALWRFWPRAEAVGDTSFDSNSGARSVVTTEPRSAESSEPTTTVYVHVIGAVTRPGVYDLSSGSRVIDAVTAAGGLLGNAAPEGVNMARVVSDGEQIAVPTRDQLASGTGVPGAQAVGGAQGGQAAGGVIDINTADAALLDTLPGVGPSTAQKIVADREANGPFASPDDLGRVPGIGPKKLDQLKALIRAR